MAAHARHPPPDAALPLLALTLKAEHPDSLADFYAGVLGLAHRRGSDGSAEFQAGWSTLRFEPAGASRVSPVYHFAFNIPHNRLDEALDWARERAPVTSAEDGAEVHAFGPWNARAFYFHDPAGNIVEFIARRTLPNATDRPFSGADIGEVSEIGIVTDDVAGAVEALGTSLGVRPYLGRRSDEFTAIGDAHGLVIVVERARRWLGSDQVAASFPLRVKTRAAAPGVVRIDGAECEIESVA